MRCRVCGGHLRPWFRVPFDKDVEGSELFTYHKCCGCHALQCVEMLNWSASKYRELVYNDEYLLHDPDFELTRPQNMVHFMGEVFGDLKSSAVHLDYGGGKGTLAALMRDNGWNSSSYDPFYDTGSSVGGPYNIVSMFEVVEHHPDPIALFDSVRALLEPYGLIVFSTLLSDNYVSHSIPGGEDWWYAKPRVGHVMLHSKDSVRHIARRLGFGLKMIEDRGCVMGNFYSEIE